jgi:mono/diheme cytochrome c family protein
MTQRLLTTLGFAGIFFLLAGCQESAKETNSPPVAEDEPGITNLPSLAELLGTPAPDIGPLPILNPDEIALGRIVYIEYCAECHGENLEGEADWQNQNQDQSFRPPPHDASGHTWHHGDKVLIESIKFGGERLSDNIGGFSNMPAFEDTLTEDEIAAVLAYIKSTWPEDIRRLQWEQTNREQTQ